MAKKSRRKGMRRSYLKVFSCGYINTGHSPNRDLIAGYNNRAVDDNLFKLFHDVSKDAPNAPRKEIIDRLNRVKEFFDKVQVKSYYNVMLVQNDNMKLFLFHNGIGTSYVFVKHDLKKGVFYRSLVYSNRALAMQRLFASKVVWIEAQQETAEKPPSP